MKLLLITTLTLTALAGTKAVYDEDNRKDIYEVKNKKYLKWAKSTAAMIHGSYFNKNESDDKVSFDISGTKTLGQSMNLCSSVKFQEQAASSSCTTFLISPNHVMTAAHCMKKEISFNNDSVNIFDPCEQFAFVFDYNMKSKTQTNFKKVELDRLRTCKKVVTFQYDREKDLDYAIVELNKPVLDREPLKLNMKNTIKEIDHVAIIGTPSGLPTKISDQGYILHKEGNNLITNLDAFSGNSGSPVINVKTGLVEGVLVSGGQDYLPSDEADENSCKIVNTCSLAGDECKAFVEDDDGKKHYISFERVMNIYATKDEFEKI